MFEKILVKIVRIYFCIVAPIGLLVILAIDASISIGVLVWFEDFLNEPPSSSYKERLELMTNIKLSSCRVIKKTYREDEYYAAIFKLNQHDFNKSLDIVQADTSFLYGSDIDLRYFTIKMLQKKGIDTLLIDYRYKIPSFDYARLYFLKQKRMIVIEGNIIN
jgi:hypothetical protein